MKEDPLVGQFAVWFMEANLLSDFLKELEWGSPPT